MKINNYESIIRDKLDSLGTLDGGIVFGKEEAWEKLQSRLDRKPAKKIVFKWWLAAAAVLMIFVLGAGLIYLPQKQINGIAQMPGPTIKIVERGKINIEPKSNNTTPAIVAVKAYNVKTKLVSNRAVRHKHMKTESAASQPTLERSTALPINNLPGLPDKNAPVIRTVANLKVVHFNDLASAGSPGYIKPQPEAAQKVAINKMKVVSFNDLEDNRSKKMMEEAEAKYQEQNVANKLNNIINSKGYSTLNPLRKIKVNTQN
jgi:hypothetical protein